MHDLTADRRVRSCSCSYEREHDLHFRDRVIRLCFIRLIVTRMILPDVRDEPCWPSSSTIHSQMRRTYLIPAIQLRSVAARYQPRHRQRPWHLASHPSRAVLADSQRPLSAAQPIAEDDEDPEAKLQRLEAILFLAREPLNSRKLSQHANLADGTQARTLVRRLNQRLDQSGRAFRIQEVAGGFQLTTRPKFAKWLRRLDHVPGAERLSAPALETLAVVAYQQPVMRADVEAIRGVSCGEILNQLMSRDLVRVGGRSNELGRPYLYNTTKRFLQLFGLRSLDELPEVEAFKNSTSNEQDDRQQH